MKKKGLKITVITVLALVVLFIVGKPVYRQYVTTQYFKTHTDETLTEWLTEHYQEVRDGQKDYTFDLKIETMSQDPYYNDPDSDIRFPAIVEEHYTVTVLQNEKLVKFEKTYTDRFYNGWTIRIHLRNIRRDALLLCDQRRYGILLLSRKRNVRGKNCQDAEVAHAFDALLFPEDLNFLEKINEITAHQCRAVVTMIFVSPVKSICRLVV